MTPLSLSRRIVRVVASLACPLAFFGALLGACSGPQPPTVPLYRALQVGDLDQIKRHLYYGSDISSPDAQGEYPLHVAARNGQIAIARVLVDHGARLDVRDPAGRTPLHLALAEGRTELAAALFDAGAQDSPQVLLFALVREGSADRDVLALLRRRGANLNALDDSGQAPLHLAVGTGRIALAKRLVLAGADTNLPDAEGQTPLTLARKGGDADLIRMLRQYGARGPAPGQGSELPPGPLQRSGKP